MNTELGIIIAGPVVSPEEVEQVCEYLRGKGWLRAAALDAALEFDDRKMRAIAEASDGRILSGQTGYRLFDGSTPLDEADRAAAWLESQGKKMLKRGAAIRRRFHRYAQEQATNGRFCA